MPRASRFAALGVGRRMALDERHHGAELEARSAVRRDPGRAERRRVDDARHRPVEPLAIPGGAAGDPERAHHEAARAVMALRHREPGCRRRRKSRGGARRSAARSARAPDRARSKSRGTRRSRAPSARRRPAPPQERCQSEHSGRRDPQPHGCPLASAAATGAGACGATPCPEARGTSPDGRARRCIPTRTRSRRARVGFEASVSWALLQGRKRWRWPFTRRRDP